MKSFLKTGFIALLPLLLTILLLYTVFGFLYGTIAVPIGGVIKWGVTEILGQTEEEVVARGGFFGWLITRGAPILGFVIGFGLTLLFGFLAATFVGKRLSRAFEKIFRQLPVIRVVYPYARQFTDFFLGDEKKMEFKNAVAVPFPYRGAYSIGFITSEGLKSINEAAKNRLVGVFIPAAPTPLSGFILYVPREDVLFLPISVDEAFRLILSVGILTPPHQVVRLPEGVLPVSPPAALKTDLHSPTSAPGP